MKGTPTCVLVLALAILQSVQPTSSSDPLTVSSNSSSSVTSSPATTSAISSSSTSSSASATASPYLAFDLSSTELDTCSPFNIIWSWGIGANPPVKLITLSVTNINVTQQLPPASSSSSSLSASSQITNTFTDLDSSTDTVARRQIIPSVASGSVLATGTVSAAPGSSTQLAGLIESLSTALDPSVQSSFTWDQVNLPQGWYEFLATATDAGDVLGGVGGIWTTWNASSEPIFIRNSSDVSCLATITTSTSSSSSGATNTAGQSSPSAGGSLSTTSHVNSGAIAGGVIGGLAALVVIIGACLAYLRGRRYRNGLNDAGDGTSPRPNFGKWGALGSFDSANGSRSAPKSTVKAEGTDDFDPVTVLNTAANTRPQKSGGFSLGDIGLAAIGLAKPQDSPPSAFTTKSKRVRRTRQAKDSSGTTESTGAIMSSSFSSSFSPPSSSAHGSYDPYADFPRGYSNTSTRQAEEDFAYSPSEQTGMPMRNLSPSSSPTEEDYSKYQSYVPSTDSLDSGAPGVGTIPIGYEPSPFVTPPPSEPASRHNSRSYSRSSLAPSGNTQAFSALGISDSSTSDGFRPNRARSQSQNVSPTSTRPMRGPDVPESPKHEFVSSAQNKRASSPDAFVYTLNPEQTQSSSSAGKAQSRRTPRKPVPSYTPDEALGAFTETVTSPTSPVYTYPGPVPTKPAKAATTRRPAPTIPASESASSSTSSFPATTPTTYQRAMNPYGSHVPALEHKDSAQSLASLRNMEGDLSAYNAVLGNEGAKHMHILIPDMPLTQN
ncbi:hypothetical protein F5051DRAFT_409151 [Lentinula edodes]|nr:hypothetical protein F5051DRAFT_409151 [Lentinula edodes]